MFSGLSTLKPSEQPVNIELWEKDDLKSFQKPMQIEEPPEDSFPEPEDDLVEFPPVVTQASLMSHEPSYCTYLRAEDLHPSNPGNPDRNMHNYGQHCLNGFLWEVAQHPRAFQKEVRKRRGEPKKWWQW